tara:strand:- start:72 stop:683 length:612 start_codon:yes stop_codon:yes gene_type:complete
VIELAHKIIREQIRKYRAGYKSPEEIDNALYRSLIDFYNLLFMPKINSQELSRYIKEQVCNISSTNSFSLAPDFNKPIIIKSNYVGNVYEGEILEEREYLDRINSAILTPDLEFPIARILNGNIEFFPSDAGNYIFSYYRSPVKPKFNYTVPDGRNVVYTSVGSIDLDINPNSINNVIVGSLGYLGISLKEDSLLLEKQVSGN